MNSGLQAVLFDFDGVLASTIEDHHHSWNEIFKEYGVQIGWEEFARLEGQSLFWISERLCAHHGIGEDAARDIAVRKNELYKRTKTPRFYPDANGVLDRLQGRLRLGLVTGAHADRFVLSTSDSFRSRFGAIVTADDVVERKPHAQPYEKAMEQLGVEPGGVIVVENAPFGIQSAIAAGARCVALRTTLPDDDLQEADWIVDNLTQAELVIRREAGW